MNYNFPKTIFADTNTWVQQVEHLLSEADEVAVEFKKWKREAPDKRDMRPLFDEIADLLHSIDTMGQINQKAMNLAMVRVIKKNKERGYYPQFEANRKSRVEPKRPKSRFQDRVAAEAELDAMLGEATEELGALKTKGISEGKPTEPELHDRILRAKTRRLQELGEVEAHEELPGGSTPSQYAIPEGAKDLQDLIEHREMNFADGNIFKATYRKGTCSHSDELRDARKVLWFAEREVKRLEGES